MYISLVKDLVWLLFFIFYLQFIDVVLSCHIQMITMFFLFCSHLTDLLVAFLFPQNKIAMYADKFEEEDLILKVGESMEARSLSSLFFILSLH